MFKLAAFSATLAAPAFALGNWAGVMGNYEGNILEFGHHERDLIKGKVVSAFVDIPDEVDGVLSDDDQKAFDDAIADEPTSAFMQLRKHLVEVVDSTRLLFGGSVAPPGGPDGPDGPGGPGAPGRPDGRGDLVYRGDWAHDAEINNQYVGTNADGTKEYYGTSGADDAYGDGTSLALEPITWDSSPFAHTGATCKHVQDCSQTRMTSQLVDIPMLTKYMELYAHFRFNPDAVVDAEIRSTMVSVETVIDWAQGRPTKPQFKALGDFDSGRRVSKYQLEDIVTPDMMTGEHVAIKLTDLYPKQSDWAHLPQNDYTIATNLAISGGYNTGYFYEGTSVRVVELFDDASQLL